MRRHDSKRCQNELKDMEQIIGLQSDVITPPHPPPDILYTQGVKEDGHGMSRPDCAVSRLSLESSTAVQSGI